MKVPSAASLQASFKHSAHGLNTSSDQELINLQLDSSNWFRDHSFMFFIQQKLNVDYMPSTKQNLVAQKRIKYNPQNRWKLNREM